MKMFLTRLGFGSKMVITGDITQVDLPTGASGLQKVTRVLESIDDIHFAYLGSEDVVRHNLVGRIVDAYTRYDSVEQARQYERRTDRSEQQSGGRTPTDHRPPSNRAERRAHEARTQSDGSGS
jgi:phosphate starvation-inducible PhoH-like protein